MKFCSGCGSRLEAEAAAPLHRMPSPAAHPPARQESRPVPHPEQHRSEPVPETENLMKAWPPPFLRRLAAAFLASLVLLFISANRSAVPPLPEKLLAQMQTPPVQTPSTVAPFKVTKRGITYDVTPKFDYELYGLTTTFHNSNSAFDSYHARVGDVFNIKDVCVVWGSNASSGIYRQIEFTSGDFFCWFHMHSQAVYDAFNQTEVSNNHIVADDPQLIKKVMSVRRGDEIYMKGMLVDYSNGGNPPRRSSTTRSDTGNGACEVVFVTDFRILRRANTFWHATHSLLKFAIFAEIVLMLLVVFGVIGDKNSVAPKLQLPKRN